MQPWSPGSAELRLGFLLSHEVAEAVHGKGGTVEGEVGPSPSSQARHATTASAHPDRHLSKVPPLETVARAAEFHMRFAQNSQTRPCLVGPVAAGT